MVFTVNSTPSCIRFYNPMNTFQVLSVQTSIFDTALCSTDSLAVMAMEAILVNPSLISRMSDSISLVMSNSSVRVLLLPLRRLLRLLDVAVLLS